MTRAALALLLLATALTGCGSDDDDVLTVLAASSLTEVFHSLEADFEEAHGVDVRFAFGSSTTLAQQAADGAPGDVLATADAESMQLARAADVLASDPDTFATNGLVLAVRRGSSIQGWSDLADARWVRCADEVPCGRLARELHAQSPQAGEPASLEVDVKAVLAKVVSGEADAGLVYASDAIAAGSAVRRVALPRARLTTPYLAAPLTGGRVELARAWLALLASPEGERALREAGFQVPRRD